MDLQAHIKRELWQAIESTYLSEHYSHSVVEAWIFLRDLIREKSGLDGDGQSLIGSALEGSNPRIRLNKFQTETEKNIQKGYVFLLRGLYQGIRSPRSHETDQGVKDSKSTADAIIYFVDYLARILDASEEEFTISGFFERIKDPDFVESASYADLLVEEIPNGKRLDTLIEVHREKAEIPHVNLSLIANSLRGKLSAQESLQFLKVVSDEFRGVEDDSIITKGFRMIDSESWEKLDSIPKLRIENKILKAVQVGEVYSQNGNIRTPEGVLGSWGSKFALFFSMKEDLKELLLKKLSDDDTDDVVYVVKYYLGSLPYIFEKDEDIDKIVDLISSNLEALYIRKNLPDIVIGLPEIWQNKFATALAGFTDPDNPAVFLADGTPFMRANIAEEVDEDEIPF